MFVTLVLERRRVLPRDELADALWGESLPSSWDSALRNLVSRVRAFVGEAGLDPDEAMVGTRDGYQLRLPEDAVVDVEEAADLVQGADAAAADGQHREAAEAAAAARAALTPPLLAGVDNVWLDAQRERLSALRVRAAELEAGARLALGDAGAAVVAAADAVAAAPYRESAFRLLMGAHAAAGNRAEALRVYERCRRMLAEEMGVSPSPETEADYVALLGTEPDPSIAAPLATTSGTVTFLFTDIEGSSTRWEQDAEAMAAALVRHDELITVAVTGNSGRVFKHTGDGVCAVFASASDAVVAAVAAQRALAAADWGRPGPLRVRIGVHTGEAEVRGDDYAGVALNRIGRLCALASGGQILASASTRLIVDGRLPPPVALQYLAEVELRGMAGTEAVYQVTHPDLRADFPAVHTGHRQGSSLAIEDAALIGRDADLASVLAATDASRLVTITGVGGVGKTRLALAAAHRVSQTYGDRTWWVELASVDPDAVAYAVANVVGGARQGMDALAATIARLDAAPAFLVLDNCEHAVEAVKLVVEALLAACADLNVLTTSRATLGVATEHAVNLAPLAAPAEDAGFDAIVASPAVEVFVRRAQAASHGFTLTESNAAAVAEIARRLDGLPLALELAAARVRSIPPAQIAAHLDERFRLLRGAHRDASGRERRLEDVVRWSYELLDAAEAGLFDQLSVFAGGFSIEAAAAVAGLDILDVSDLIDALVSRSMLVVVDDATFARYALLETMREFGRANLDAGGEAANVIGRHRDYYVALATSAAAGLQSREEAWWVRAVHADLANIRAAFVRAAAVRDVNACAEIVVGLFDYAFFRMRREVGLWAAETVALPGAADHPLYPQFAGVAGHLAWERGDIDNATTYAESAVAAGSTWLGHDALGTIRLFQGRVADAVEAFTAASESARSAGNDYRLALALGQLAFSHVLTAADQSDDVAVELAVEAEAVAGRTGNPTAVAHAAWSMGLALFDRDPAGALEALARCIEISREVDNRMALGAAATPAEELRTKLSRRTLDDDLRAAVEHIDYWVKVDNTANLWGVVRRVARDFAALGDAESAAVALGADAEASLKLPLREREQARHEAVVADVRAALGPDVFAAQMARGAAMTPSELVEQLRAAVAELGDHRGN